MVSPTNATRPTQTMSGNTQHGGDYGIARDLMDADDPYNNDGETIAGNTGEQPGATTTTGTLDDILNHMDGIDQPVHEQLANMTDLEKAIVAHAAKHPDATQTEVADAVGTTQPTVSTTLNDYPAVYETAKKGFLDDALGTTETEMESVRIQATPETAETIRNLVRSFDNDTAVLPMETAPDTAQDDETPGWVRMLDYIREYRRTHGNRPTLRDLRECPVDLPVADPSAALTTLANYENLLHRTENDNGTYVYKVNEQGKQKLREHGFC